MEFSDQDQDFHPEKTSAKIKRNKALSNIGILFGGLVFLAIFIGIIYYLLLDSTPTSKIRDTLIVFMAFELLLIGLTIILFILQTARLINLFQNEIKPLLNTINETMGTLRGTAVFLGDSLAKPVIKFNSYISAFRRVLDIFNFKRSRE